MNKTLILIPGVHIFFILWQPYFQQSGIPIAYFGIIMGFGSLILFILLNNIQIFKPSKTTIKNQLSILPRIGFGLNFNNGYGPIMGGSISYGNNNKWGRIGVDLMYILIKQDSDDAALNQTRKHTMGINGFYERIILKMIV